MGPTTATVAEKQRQQPPPPESSKEETPLSSTPFLDADSGSNLSEGLDPPRGDREDSFTEGLDSILATISAGPQAEDPSPTGAHLTLPSAAPAPPSPVLSCELSASDLDTSERIRKKYGLATPASMASPPSAAAAEGELAMDALLNTMQQLVRQFMVEGYSSPAADGTVEEAHALLPALLATVEIALWHGIGVGPAVANGPNSSSSTNTLSSVSSVSPSLFKRSVLRSPWDLLLRLKGKDMAASQTLENIRQFSSLRTPSARMRAWLRVTLMNKTLAPDLAYLVAHHGSLIA